MKFRTYILAAFLFIIAFAIMYCFGVFIMASWDIRTWEPEARGGVASIALVAGVFLSGLVILNALKP